MISAKSYTGADIEHWCKRHPDNEIAKELQKEYFNKVTTCPSDRVYYFIRTEPKVELMRDYEKSPRMHYSKRNNY